MKIAIRADREAGVIRAYFSEVDDSERFEVGTLRIELADKDRSVYDAWVAFWEDTLRKVMTEVGLEVTRFRRFRPGDKN